MELSEQQKRILDEQLSGRPPDDLHGKKGILGFTTSRDRVILLVSVLGAVLGGVLTPLIAVIYGQLVGVFGNFATSSSTASETRDRLVTFSLYYVYVAVAIFALIYVSTVGFYYVGERVVRSLRQAYLKAILRQNMAFFDAHEAGGISTRIMSDMGTIQEGITSKISVALTAVATFGAALVISLIEHWKTGLILTPTFLLMAIFGSLTGSRALKAHMKAKPAGDQAANIAQEALSSIRHVFAFGLQDRLAVKYDSYLQTAGNLKIKAQTVISLFIAWSNTAPVLVYALCFWAGSIFLVRGEVSAGQIATITLVVNMGAFAILRIAPSAQALVSTASSITAVLGQMTRRSTQDPFDMSGTTLNDLKGDIEFEAVSLAYPQRSEHLVLDNVSLKFPAMKCTAIVGASGSGKSSIINLLERFYEPISGEITIDGVNIQALTLRWLRSQMALVGQHPVLFDTSIFENIRYGGVCLPTQFSGGRVEEQVFSAAKMANAHDFIMALPEGYQTRVGENGVQLSGGQRQRIAIARALIRDPKILLLDEATSALDSKSELAVQGALDIAASNRTTIVVAHRLSTIRNADNIIVLSQGLVVEQGTHSELIQLDGHYARLVHVQQVESPHDGVEVDVGDSIHSGHMELSQNPEDSPDVQHQARPIATKNLPQDNAKSETLGLWKTLVFLARLNREEWMALCFGLLCSVFVGLGTPAQAVVFAKVLEVLSLPPPDYGTLRSQINTLAGAFLALAFVAFIFSLGVGYSFSYAASQLARRVRDRCFRSILSHDVAFFDEKAHATGPLLSVLSASAEALHGLSGPVVGGTLTFLSTIAGGVVVSVAVGWKLALVCTATVPVVVACGWVRLQMLSLFDSRTRQSGIDSASYAAELIKSVGTVASFGLEDFVLGRYSGFLMEQAETSLRSILWASSLYAASQSVVYLAVALAFWYGGTLILDEGYSLFQFFLCLAALISGSQIAGTIFTFAPDASKAMHASWEIKKFLDFTPPSPVPETAPPNEKPLEKAEHHLRFRDVSFAYSSRPSYLALDRFDLDIAAGQHIALVGPSGCGKSTVLSLLERFYDPTSGTITMEGRNLATIEPENHRRTISLVSQDTVMYSGTIRENIAMGLPDENVPDETIWASCRQANIEDFIISLQDGLSTFVGPGGCMLSGGQRQRIAIARALVRSPKILLLDEATSALDTESEELVQRALDAAAKDRTTIVVAHRLSTIRKADRICVLNQGRMAETGTHDELVQRRGLYWELAKMQKLV
ncbi:putative ABC multidrug transporter [Xylariomycetidae sp. FL2044]|nr:putative ABC multidrug transporter [Xylariomycetidae sp. FL2044]